MEQMKNRVLIVNKFYYPRGGDCICAMNLERLLDEKDFDTAVFSMDYPENMTSEWSAYFASQVEFSGSVSKKLKAMKRIFGMGDIRDSFSRILDDFAPDIVHLHNIHSYLSPQLAAMARKRGMKVVWTLHDYKLICPSYNCVSDGQPCEDCITSPFSIVRKRCMKGSMAASVMAWLEARKWSRQVLERNVNAFVCPSGFMREMMLKGGFQPGKLHMLWNFVDPEKLKRFAQSDLSSEREDYCCYVGRLSAEKGVEMMLETVARSPYHIKVAGTGPLHEQLMERYTGCDNIEFLGYQNAEQVSALLDKATCSVIPSLCYENNPLSVIESLCAGTPVVGAEIGGIPELLSPGESGFVFRSGSREDLRRALDGAFAHNWNNKAIKAIALENFSGERHYEILKNIYQTC